jgi:nitroreductase/Pyruvate/2-oxoacid:ferredoxin oxidoreductase delta subunit
MDNPVSNFRNFLSENRKILPDLNPVPPQVNKQKCTGCGICAKVCPGLVIEIVNKKAEHTNKLYCAECGHCAAVCPAGAIEDTLAGGDDYKTLKDMPSSASLEALFLSRRSVRNYKEKPVSRKDLEKIIDAGRYAPVGGNRPDVHYIVISDPKEVARISALVLESVHRMFTLLDNIFVYWFVCAVIGRTNAQTIKFYIPLVRFFFELRTKYGIDRIFYNAPAIIITHGKKHDDSIPFSCSVALYQASLMAQPLGIGCCFNGFLQVAINWDKKINKLFDIPKGHKCYGAMALGYQKHKFLRSVRRREAQVEWK